MKQSEPKCPYCGTTMILERRCSMGMFYNCPNLNCLSISPYVKRKDGEDTKALCYEAALRRPLQKPLTLEELHALTGTDEEAVTFCEAQGDDRTYAHIWIKDLVICSDGEHIPKDHLVYESYGKYWRAWATRPTDEERAVAPWEE